MNPSVEPRHFSSSLSASERLPLNFLKSVQLHDTSCLVVDVQMPGMNGLELQSELAAAGLSIPIIFITAFDNKDTRRKAMGAGAVAFLQKPFSDEKLLQTVRSALTTRESRKST